MKITQKTQNWGNSTGIRLPKKVLSAAQWHAHQEVTVGVRGNTIILTPSTPKKALPTPSLKQLIADIHPDNRHGETDWGEPVGKELW